VIVVVPDDPVLLTSRGLEHQWTPSDVAGSVETGALDENRSFGEWQKPRGRSFIDCRHGPLKFVCRHPAPHFLPVLTRSLRTCSTMDGKPPGNTNARKRFSTSASTPPPSRHNCGLRRRRDSGQRQVEPVDHRFRKVVGHGLAASVLENDARGGRAQGLRRLHQNEIELSPCGSGKPQPDSCASVRFDSSSQSIGASYERS